MSLGRLPAGGIGREHPARGERVCAGAEGAGSASKRSGGTSSVRAHDGDREERLEAVHAFTLDYKQPNPKDADIDRARWRFTGACSTARCAWCPRRVTRPCGIMRRSLIGSWISFLRSRRRKRSEWGSPDRLRRRIAGRTRVNERAVEK